MNQHPDVIKRMAIDLGALPSRLQSIIRTAPLRYKVFYIPKRNGAFRQVAQPAREVKAIQRWMIRELRARLPVHPAAMAYEPGKSIAKNAQVHANNRFILKMDFTNFFPSIFAPDISKHLDNFCAQEYTTEEREIIVRACTWLPERLSPLQLCIGAPSSPFLSNSLMFSFDCAMQRQSEQDQVVYTRYADDIVFSCNSRDVLGGYVDFVKKALLNLTYPRITVNDRKTVHASRAGNRTVTGIVLTPTGRLSSGRDRKRLVRAMYDRKMKGLLTPDQQNELSGMLAFIDSIEPGFSAKLKARYQAP